MSETLKGEQVTSRPTCPWCYYVFPERFEAGLLPDYKAWSVLCRACRRRFRLERTLTITFRSKRLEEEAKS